MTQKLSIEDFVKILDSEPENQCVVSEEVFEDFEFTPEQAAIETGRKLSQAIEYHKMKDEPKIALRCKVFVFSAKENA